jgi:hypothetical protein
MSTGIEVDVRRHQDLNLKTGGGCESRIGPSSIRPRRWMLLTFVGLAWLAHRMLDEDRLAAKQRKWLAPVKTGQYSN